MRLKNFYILLNKSPWLRGTNPYLISEKSIWKNQVLRTGFLLPVCLACVACKNQFRDWFLQVKNPVPRKWFFKNQVQLLCRYLYKFRNDVHNAMYFYVCIKWKFLVLSKQAHTYIWSQTASHKVFWLFYFYLDWNWSKIELKWSWNWTEIALKLNWNEAEIELKLNWNWTKMKLKWNWNKTEMKLKWSWNWTNIKLKLYWNEAEIELHAIWSYKQGSYKQD